MCNYKQGSPDLIRVVTKDNLHEIAQEILDDRLRQERDVCPRCGWVMRHHPHSADAECNQCGWPGLKAVTDTQPAPRRRRQSIGCKDAIRAKEIINVAMSILLDARDTRVAERDNKAHELISNALDACGVAEKYLRLRGEIDD